MTTAQIALSVVMIVASLFLIVVVLLQSGAQQGLGDGQGEQPDALIAQGQSEPVEAAIDDRIEPGMMVAHAIARQRQP